MRFFLAILLLALVHSAPAALTTLISTNATWKYLDNGGVFIPPAGLPVVESLINWRSIQFPDATWSSGPAQLGYGDGDEATVVGYGGNASNKYITTYFRHSFNVTNNSAMAGLIVRLLVDDGAVVYLNGTELVRQNMPGSTISSNTLASSAVGGSDESEYTEHRMAVQPVVGLNVLAVEVHQSGATSSDLSFDLELLATDEPSLTRGPYLQNGTTNAISIRWRTDLPTDSVVTYGTSLTNLNSTVTNSSSVSDHEIRLTGLSNSTFYYYTVGSSSTNFASGSDYFFYTPPPVGSTNALRVWVIGDSGTANADAAAVRDAYMDYTTNRYTDVWLMLGDNAYNSGTDSEYQEAVFDMYSDLLHQTVLWSTLGNHETAQNTSPGTYPYHDIFTMPTSGEAGGLASGTEDYYSFNYGNVHFVCLNSMTASRSTNGTMWTWLESDLSANTQTWTIAFWHHPPYTKGSHNSDSETELIQMRENFLPLLEEYGVDLVLSGHSHSYERSKFIDGHYGNSASFSSAMVKASGSGQGSGAYTKSDDTPVANEGAVYIVAGSSGKISGGSLNHPAMYTSLNVLGSVILDIEANQMDVTFLDDNQSVQDSFRIIKGP